MFKGFNLKTNKDFKGEYFDIGTLLYKETKNSVEENLDKYITESGSLDGSKIQKDWFPTVNANIFLSHSHNDLNLAIGLAGYFYKEFGLTTFIDSCIWGYAETLQKKIDDKYCKSADNQTYDYTKINFSSSHVHMMLSTALSMMIDKTECIVFLNTSNSVSSPKEIIQNKTKSPWIYSEIVMTSLIQSRDLIPKERMTYVTLQEGLNYTFAQLDVDYDLDLDHLVAFNDKDLNILETVKLQLNSEDTDNLNNLYLLKKIKAH